MWSCHNPLETKTDYISNRLLLPFQIKPSQKNQNLKPKLLKTLILYYTYGKSVGELLSVNYSNENW